MVATVFIDGHSGSTGLEIMARLQKRSDLELIMIDPDLRKDKAARAQCLNEADAAILCLPDDAAQDAINLIDNPKLKLIDASSAHRVAKGWVYGFAECAPGQRRLIAEADRISNPGCHASGAVALLAPLVRTGLVPPDYPIAIHSVSGYSGGGRSMIAEFEDGDVSPPAFRAYGLDLNHKHIPEITRHAHLHHQPVFVPSVGAFRRGMLVNVPLQARALPGETTAQTLQDALADAYLDEAMIHVAPLGTDTKTILPQMREGSDLMDIYVFGSKNRILLTAHFDNLGKGAAGAAVQNLNLALGLPERSGLHLPEANS